MTPIDDLKRLLAAATKQAPLPWDEDRVGTEDGYGRYWSREIIAANDRTVCDMQNADVGEIHAEDDEDGSYRWDTVAASNAALIVAAVNAMPELIALREKVERIRTAVELVEIGSSVGMLSAKMRIAVALDQIASILKEPTP